MIAERLKRLYNWTVGEEEIVFVARSRYRLEPCLPYLYGAGEGVIAQPPVYFHFLEDPVRRGRLLADPPLIEKGRTYEIDFDAFEAAITPDKGVPPLLILNNPSVGYSGKTNWKDSPEYVSNIITSSLSDEIHCDLLYPGSRHIPIAGVVPEVGTRGITLMAPSKTFNVAGLGFAFAVIKNETLRKKWEEAARGIVPWINIMGTRQPWRLTEADKSGSIRCWLI